MSDEIKQVKTKQKRQFSFSESDPLNSSFSNSDNSENISFSLSQNLDHTDYHLKSQSRDPGVPHLSVHTRSNRKFDRFKFKVHEMSTFDIIKGKNIKEEPTNLVSICEKSSFEKVEDIVDDYPFLDTRKALMLIWIALKSCCKLIVTSIFFEYFIICVILFNTMIIALDFSATVLDLSEFELSFLLIYTFECALKVTGLGLICPKNSYLRDLWNVLDFILLILGWLSILSSSSLNLYAVRTLRILRIFRSISSIEGLRIIFIALLGSISKLVSSLILLMLFSFVFAVGGVQLFMGLLSYNCMDLQSGVINDEICGAKSCGEGFVCVNTLDNPNYGNTNFDNAAYAFIAVFQCITLEGWSAILEKTLDAFGMYSLIFFIPLTFIGAFILVDLALAIIKANFTKTMNKIKRRSEERWDEEKLLKDYALKRGDAFVEVDFKKQSEYFGGIRKVQELLSLAPQEKEDSESSISDRSNESSDHSEENKSNQENSPFGRPLGQEKQSTETPIIISNSKKPSFSIVEHRRISILKEPHLEDLDDTTIHPMRNSLKTPKKSTANYMKTAARIKVGFLSNFRNGLSSKNFKIQVSSEKIITSDSSQDINDTEKRSEMITAYNYTGYSFIYILDKTNIFEDTKDLNIKKYITKYFDSEYNIFGMISKWRGRKCAFYEIFLSVKQFILEEENRYRMSQNVIGEWSGYDVKDCRNLEVNKYNYTNYRVWSKGVIGFYQILTFPTKSLVNSKLFNKIMITIVILNTIILSIDHYGISSNALYTLNVLNLSLTIIFSLEVLLKFIGNGLISFVRDKMNTFDLIVVILSIVEIVFLSGNSSKISAFRAVRIFRLFRVLRVAKMFRYLESLTHILRAISKSMSKFVYLFMLLLLFSIIFSLLGVQIFGGRFNFYEGLPRANFDDFQSAFITIWQLLTIENWQEILYNGMRSPAGEFSCIFLVIWIIIGNFILLNLFLAILLDSFTEDSENIIKNERKLTIKQSIVLDVESSEESEDVTVKENKTRDQQFYNIKCETSYFVFSKDSKIRKMCFDITSSGYFEYVILVVIISNSVKLVWDTYIINYSNDSAEQIISLYLDITFTVIFGFEFLVKSVSVGFVVEDDTYLRDNWNKIDFTIVIISIIDLSMTSFTVPSIKILRLLRTFRPLRLLSHNLSMKIVVTAMIESIISIINVVSVLALFGLIFSILGVSLFGGMLYKCSNPLITTETQCLSSGYSWLNNDYNFDNIYEAGITLFILTSEEGWPDIMHKGMDTVAQGKAPEINASPSSAYYFIAYVLLGSFFFLNLFIAVIFEKFTEAKLRESSFIAQGLSKEQLLWVEMQRLAVKSKPKNEVVKPPENIIRQKIFFFTSSEKFEWVIGIFIFLNFVTMSIYFKDASESNILALKYANYILNSVFIIEIILKIIGMGFKKFIKNNWNKFDLLTAMISIVGMIVENVGSVSGGAVTTTSQLIRLIRIVRIIRVLRVIKFLASLEEILTIISYSLPAILNVLSLLLLIFFMYSVLGVFTFSQVPNGREINSHFNFESFHSAMLTLYRMSTGEDWYVVMYDCAKVVGKPIALLYFCSFITITSFLLMNLFIMVILQNYEDYEDKPESALMLFNKHVKWFRKVWDGFAMHNHGIRIHYRDLPDFLYELGNELGYDRKISQDMVLKYMVALQLDMDDDGFIYYNDMLYIVLKKLYRKRFRNSLESRMLVDKTEKISTTELKKIRSFNRQKYLNKERSLEFKGTNLFFTLMYTKAIFRSWKALVQSNKDVNGFTYSECEFPGENSLKDDEPYGDYLN